MRMNIIYDSSKFFLQMALVDKTMQEEMTFRRVQSSNLINCELLLNDAKEVRCISCCMFQTIYLLF